MTCPLPHCSRGASDACSFLLREFRGITKLLDMSRRRWGRLTGPFKRVCTVSIIFSLFVTFVNNHRTSVTDQTSPSVFAYKEIASLYDNQACIPAEFSQHFTHVTAEVVFYNQLMNRPKLLTVQPNSRTIFFVPFFPIRLDPTINGDLTCKQLDKGSVIAQTAKILSDSPWLGRPHFIVSNYWRWTVLPQTSPLVSYFENFIVGSYEVQAAQISQLGQGVYAPAAHTEVIPYVIPSTKHLQIASTNRSHQNFLYIGSDVDTLLHFSCDARTPGIRTCLKGLKRTDSLFSVTPRTQGKRLPGIDGSTADVPTHTRNSEELVTIMSTTAFCLVFAGDTRSSAVFFSAVCSGCLPVVISDGLSLPFEWKIPYNTFVIRVEESMFAAEGNRVLDTILREYGNPFDSDSRAHMMKQYMAQYADDLCWHTETSHVLENIVLAVGLASTKLPDKSHTTMMKHELVKHQTRPYRWTLPLQGCKRTNALPAWALMQSTSDKIILLGIISPFSLRHKREYIRQHLQYILSAFPCIAYVFVEGVALQSELFLLEQDVLKVRSLDSYEMLTSKVLGFFGYASILNVDFAIKVDDSTILNPSLITEAIRKSSDLTYMCLGDTGGAYVGTVPEAYRTWHQGKSQNPEYNTWRYSEPFDVKYCQGSYGYVLGSMSLFIVYHHYIYHYHELVRSREIYEDKYIGEVLHRYDVNPVVLHASPECELSRGFESKSTQLLNSCISFKDALEDSYLEAHLYLSHSPERSWKGLESDDSISRRAIELDKIKSSIPNERHKSTSLIINPPTAPK